MVIPRPAKGSVSDNVNKDCRPSRKPSTGVISSESAGDNGWGADLSRALL